MSTEPIGSHHVPGQNSLRSFTKLHIPGPAPAPAMYSQFVWCGAYVSVRLKSLLRAPSKGQPRLSTEPFLPDEGAEALRCPDLAQFKHGSQHGGRSSPAPAHSFRLTLQPTAAHACLTPSLKDHCLKLKASPLPIGILASQQSKICIEDGHSDICCERPQPCKGVLNSPDLLVLGSRVPQEYEVEVFVYPALPQQSP